MNHWIFQGNPDVFDLDTYISNNTDIVWSVRQTHFTSEMNKDDEIFIWRASGSAGLTAGIVARGVLTGLPAEMKDDVASMGLWTEADSDNIEMRVPVRITEKCLGAKEIVQRDWLKNDPIVSEMRILKFFSETNYQIESNEAERLAALVRNTGKDWNRAESIAGLWAYAKTLGKSVSRLPGSPVVEVALSIGRAVTGVYNKVMNFRALDPTDLRKGLSAGSSTDKEVWSEFFDAENGKISLEELNAEYFRLWGKGPVMHESKVSYQEFGDAPNDDPEELQMFAARVRKGQPAFRKNILVAYGQKCTISGWGPAEVLEAVHIMPHAKTGINELDNGLLLRCDLHSLFDANLLRINPVSLTIVVDDSLADTPYWDLNGKALIPRIDGTQIGSEYLKQRWDS